MQLRQESRASPWRLCWDLEEQIQLGPGTDLAGAAGSALKLRREGHVIWEWSRKGPACRGRGIPQVGMAPFLCQRNPHLEEDRKYLIQKDLRKDFFSPKNAARAEFFKQRLDKLFNYSHSSYCLMGDWNGIISPQKDKASDKGINCTQGKWPKTFFKMVEDLGVTDI